jgi:hypothetical protein
MGHMNKYKRWHDKIIARARKRERLPNEYYEKHHIKPVALGGRGKEKVWLTYREHFVVHWLLTKFTRGKAKRAMCFAMYRMCAPNGQRIIAAWQYEIAKKAQREAMNGNQYMRGYRFTAAQKRAVSRRLMGNRHLEGVSYPHTEKWKQAMSRRMMGNHHAKGRKWSRSEKRRRKSQFAKGWATRRANGTDKWCRDMPDAWII